jgi:hypothetical protein
MLCLKNSVNTNTLTKSLHLNEPLAMCRHSGPQNKKLIWNDWLEAAFLELKQMVAMDTFLDYPDWSKPFDIHMDASDNHVGTVISQEGKLIAFY